MKMYGFLIFLSICKVVFGALVVQVSGGSPSQMFEVGIKELGGMEKFIKKGQTVLVKPNIAWDRKPEIAATTNPELVGKIIEMAYKAGAKEVWVFDHTVHEEKAAYRNSGIEEVVRKNNGKMFSSKDEKDYKKVLIPKAKLLKEALVHKKFIEADVIINVPILKVHGTTRMTAALKNLMGVVWDRRFYHREGLSECIADFGLFRKVDLTVIDAYRVLKNKGPQGMSIDDVELKKTLVLSTDMISADAVGAKILGINITEELLIAEKLGVGSLKSTIKSINL